MSSHILCSDSDPQWLEERRKRVTASDMLCFLGMEPPWWSGSWDEILHHKIANTQKTMDLEGTVNVTHGRMTEALNVELTGQLLGFPVVRHNFMYVNDRWPHLGATLDGLLFPVSGAGPDLDLTTHTGLTAELVEALEGLGGAVTTNKGIMLESKNARHPDPYGSKRKKGEVFTWAASPPEYHLPQLQTGMWVAGFRYAVIAARLGGRDMAAHLVVRDPEWEGVLDEANARAGEILR